MLRKVSICLAVIAFIICLWLYWKHSAFDLEMKTKISRISLGTGPTTYGFLADCYFFAALFLLTFVVGKLIRPKIISFTVSTASLGLIIFQLWKIKEWYSLILNTFTYYSNEPDFELLRNSVPFAYLCFFITLILFIIQMSTAFSLQEKQRTTRILS